MKLKRLKNVTAAGVLTLMLTSSYSAPFGFSKPDISPQQLKLVDKTDNYTIVIKDVIGGEPGFIRFHVISPHAEYDVEGLIPLKKLLHEIDVIEQVKKGNAGTGFKDGAADSVKATGEGLASLVSNPKDSAKAIGKATGKLGKRIGGVFRKKEEGEKSSFGEKFLGSAEREVAKELGVDVYTTNPYLHEILSKMARSRSAGKGVAAIGKFLLPVAGVVSVALTASGVNAAADQFVNNTARIDLFNENKKELMTLGYSESDVLKLLNSELYSPREVTYLRFYLVQLKGTEGLQRIFEQAVNANSVWGARKVLYALQIAADASVNQQNVRIDGAENAIALEQKDRLLILTPFDWLDQGDLEKNILEYALSLKKNHPGKNVEIWNAGKVTSVFSSEALPRGIRTKEWML